MPRYTAQTVCTRLLVRAIRRRLSAELEVSSPAPNPDTPCQACCLARRILPAVSGRCARYVVEMLGTFPLPSSARWFALPPTSARVRADGRWYAMRDSDEGVRQLTIPAMAKSSRARSGLDRLRTSCSVRYPSTVLDLRSCGWYESRRRGEEQRGDDTTAGSLSRCAICRRRSSMRSCTGALAS